MRYLLIEEKLALQARLISVSGGSTGIREMGSLQSAAAQPRMAFGGQDLYPDLTEKAAALCFSLVMNHPFMDGNKRVGHAAMETMLVLNGHEIVASIDEAEELILKLAAGQLPRPEFTAWVKAHVTPIAKRDE